MVKLFTQIQIQTKTRCNLNCSFCPNSKHNQPKTLLDIALYKRIITELKKLNFEGRLTLYLQNEPSLDLRIIKFIKIARAELNCRINISTNGIVWDYKDVLKLFKAGLDDLDVSCYSDAILKKWSGGSDERINAIDLRVWGGNKLHLSNRGGNLDIENGEVGTGYCEKPFEVININAEGKVILCCADYKWEVVVGDVKKETLINIWNCDLLNRYRKELIKGKRDLPLCNECNYHLGK